MTNIAPYLKALVAALVAGLSVVSTQLAGGQSLGGLTAGDWLGAAIAFLVALGAVFAVPNKIPPE